MEPHILMVFMALKYANAGMGAFSQQEYASLESCLNAKQVAQDMIKARGGLYDKEYKLKCIKK